MDLSILSQRDKVLNLVVEKLGRTPVDFSEKRDDAWLAAGVLLLLFFRGDELVFQLTKRASTVPQPGDISCPGGTLNTFLDPLLRPFMTNRFSPILREDVLEYAQKRGKFTFRNVKLFLTNALRESWEEIGLNPFNVMFLGPLPCYDLITFRRRIFPLTGFVKNEWHFRPNWEVDRIVEIPLRTFFNDENYGLCSVESSSELKKNIARVRNFPCLIYRDEVLWGATFYIIMNFLKIVFDLELPGSHSKRVVKKVLCPDYMTGSRKK
ncbi:MAG: CoA pyrophosphatase [Thermodesulfobacteriota bacterium]|nr:CoA pyrophosphatase [Thermodesulfobacteriota bacterium]